jgi:hypothetical protein
VEGELKRELNEIIEEAASRYRPLVYHYDEDLLQKVDRIEARLRGAAVEAKEESERLIPGLEPAEEDDHFRETFRRWATKSGRDLRATIDDLKRQRAGLDPSKPFHPEFHRKFSEAFDDLIAVEVAEIRERRNREIQRRGQALLDRHRSDDPMARAAVEQVLEDPQYRVPDAAGSLK